MPAPTRKYCTDKFIYTFLHRYITPFTCKHNISPNIVTLFNIFWTFLIFWAVSTKSNKYLILIAMMLYHVFDCLDGAIARNCNRQSKIGAILDHISDGLYMVMHLIVLYQLISEHKRYAKHAHMIKKVSLLFSVLLLDGFLSHVFKDKHSLFNMFSSSVVHDNGLLLHVLFWLFVYNTHLYN